MGESVTGEVVGGEPVRAEPRGGSIGAAALIVLCLVVHLPGFFGVPPTESEARYAQGARQVFEAVALDAAHRERVRHRLVVPRVQERAMVGEPPLTMWMQAASASVWSGGNPYRDSVWMYRVPSLVAAVVLVLVTRRLGASMFDAGAGRLAAVLAAVTPVVLWQARQATPDMMRAACVAAAMWLMWRAYSPSERGGRLGVAGALGFWVVLAGAGLCGGIAAVLVVVLAAVVLSWIEGMQALRDLRPLMGVPVFAAIVGAYVAVAGREVGAWPLVSGFLRELAWNGSEVFLPPGMFAVFAPLLLWPASLLLPAGLLLMWKLGRARRRGMQASHPGYAFVFAWLVPTWIVLEVLPGKTSAMAVLLVSPAAILGARAILAAGAGALPDVEARVSRMGRVAWLVAGAGLIFGGLSLIAIRLIVWPGSMLVVIGAGGLGVLGAVAMFRGLGAAWRSVVKGLYARASVAGVGIMLLLAVMVPMMALPRAMGFSREISGALAGIDPSGSRPVGMEGLDSASLVFLTRGRAERVAPGAGPEWRAKHPDGLLVRERAVDSAGTQLARVTGFDPRLLRAREMEVVGR